MPERYECTIGNTLPVTATMRDLEAAYSTNPNPCPQQGPNVLRIGYTIRRLGATGLPKILELCGNPPEWPVAQAILSPVILRQAVRFRPTTPARRWTRAASRGAIPRHGARSRDPS